MRERLVIVFIAVAVGLLVTTLIFFLYQQTKTIPQKTITSLVTPTETPKEKAYLALESPGDEEISDRRSIQVKGKTSPENIVIVSTNVEDKIVKPTSDGRFAATITIDSNANVVVVRAIEKSGEEAVEKRIITYSTEDF